MVRQGFSVSLIPAENGPFRYELWVTSQGWEGTEPVVTRQMHVGTVNGYPHEFFPHDFAEWVDGMMGVMKAEVTAYLKVKGTKLVSAEQAYRDDLAQTTSQEA